MKNKQTKIIATISDTNCSTSFIKELYDNGMDVVRLNTAHQTPETTLKIIKNVRNVSHKISLLLDIKGPEMRTTKVNEPINFKRGDSVSLRGGTKVSTKECVYIAYNAFVRDVPKDSTILIDDGELEMVVKQRTKQDLICEIIHDGYLKSRKTVNVPGIRINLPTLTSKDRTYIKFAVRHKLDFIALSFVRRKQDVITLRNILKKHKSPIQIISKIENHEGVENIDEIISASDGIMIARGDLGVEKPPEEVPLIQKSIINKSILSAKCVITATQMMQSMIDNPRPTRAEVSDVANAILDGTDAVMLSGETAYGKYPIHAVKVMARIAKSVEADKAPFKYYLMKKKPEDVRMRLAKSAVSLVSDDPFNAIVMISRKGSTARFVSSFRGNKRIFAACYNPTVMRQLTLCYGIYPTLIEQFESTDDLVTGTVKQLVKTKRLAKDDFIVILGATPGAYGHATNFLEINTVKNCLKIRS